MMFRKIDKLQSDVDQMLDLCAEVGLTPEEPVSVQDKKNLRLAQMILKAQDGELEQRTLLRMGKWLACDEQALRYYIDFQIVTVLLHQHFNKNWLDKFLGRAKELIAVGSA